MFDCPCNKRNVGLSNYKEGDDRVSKSSLPSTAPSHFKKKKKKKKKKRGSSINNNDDQTKKKKGERAILLTIG